MHLRLSWASAFLWPQSWSLGSVPTGVLALFQHKQMQTNWRPVPGRLAADCKQTNNEEDQELLLDTRLTDYPEAGQRR